MEVQGRRKRGRPKMRWKDRIMSDMKMKTELCGED